MPYIWRLSNKNDRPYVDEEQIQASYLAYNLGSIDYVQFIQNVEAAINTKQKFIIQQAEYFELSASLKQLTGK